MKWALSTRNWVYNLKFAAKMSKLTTAICLSTTIDVILLAGYLNKVEKCIKEEKQNEDELQINQ